MKTRQSLENIQRLNLWGSNLEDISVIQHLTNLEVAGLTINKINSLADFQHCLKLKELYLRGNRIPSDIQQLHYLRKLRNLRILNLAENPISVCLPFYRKVVLKFLPWLEKLDDVPVSDLELVQAKNFDITKPESFEPNQGLVVVEERE